MTVNQSFQNWTVISDEPGEQLIFEHDQTGERVTLDQDGSVAAPVVDLNRLFTDDRDPHIVIKEQDGTLIALDDTGVISSTSTTADIYYADYLNIAQVLQDALDSLPAGRTQPYKIKIQPGIYGADSDITTPSFVYFDCPGVSIRASNKFPDDTPILHGNGTVEQVFITGPFTLYGDGGNNSVVNHSGLNIKSPDGSATKWLEGFNYFEDVIATQFPGDGIVAEGRRDHYVRCKALNVNGTGIKSTKSDTFFLDCISWNNGRGWDITGDHNTLVRPISQSNETEEIAIDGLHTRIENGYMELGAGDGIVVGRTVSVSDTQIVGAQIIDNDGDQIIVNGDENIIKDTLIYDDPNTSSRSPSSAITISSGQDNEIVRCDWSDNPTGVTDNGTRTRIDGVIGGGELGGVDISTVTGAAAGDKALTSGASGAPATVIAVLDENGDWIYPTKGGAVTPA